MRLGDVCKVCADESARYPCFTDPLFFPNVLNRICECKKLFALNRKSVNFFLGSHSRLQPEKNAGLDPGISSFPHSVLSCDRIFYSSLGHGLHCSQHTIGGVCVQTITQQHFAASTFWGEAIVNAPKNTATSATRITRAFTAFTAFTSFQRG
jgi:hypothetical protein